MGNEFMLKKLGDLRQYFDSGASRPYSFRVQQLKKLKAAILDHEKELYEALRADLGKSMEESWVTELGLVIAEINAILKGLRQWIRPERISTNLLNLPSKSYVIREPLGVVLIIGPWNYPFQLLINPLLGAIAAGNCVVLKPSEYAPATAAVLKNIVESCFNPEHILLLEGDGAIVIPDMMNQFRFDHVFYTGGEKVGKIIYGMAAEKLIPVTLELGGKSPCIVESDASIRVAARRIAVTKFSNAGQMCVAPDYILVHASRKEDFLKALRKYIRQFYTDEPETCYNYGKMINEKQFDRVVGYLSDGIILFGGRHNRDKLFIEPTLLETHSPETPVMKEEIFGPVLPVLSFETAEEALSVINRNPHPLSFYVFTRSRKKAKYWVDTVSAGGACINNCSWHFTNYHLPFGGKGGSGTGRYHGKHSFETFSHQKSVMETPTWFDPALKYPPFKGKLRLFKQVIR